ncbi:MAG TPA: AAA family ATPase, partial [Solirubrobacteraceae bacterium]|nr:AAA family ATPase [Solirubrobacteraceae bacterium]
MSGAVAEAGPGDLLERREELHAIAQALAATAGGRGGVVYVEADGGLGKTRLLAELERRAEGSGLAVLRARGHDFESDHAFGLALQLFENRVRRAAPAERAELLAGAAARAASLLTPSSPAELSGPASGLPSTGDGLAVLHALFWLTSNLSEVQPLLLSIDDAHLGDEPSLRFLLYLTQRVEELPVLVAVGSRPPAAGPAADVLPQLRRHPATRTLSPAPLSTRGVGWLVAEAGFPGADADFVDACAEASGGNPLYLRELLGVLTRAGATVDADTVRRIGPRAVAESIYFALGRLPDKATALARAVAVLGPDASIRAAARVAGIEDADAAPLAAQLATAGVFAHGARLDFAHPILRSAVYEDLRPIERAWGHARAAAVLGELGASPDRVAGHLLRCDRGGEEWAAGALSQAGRRALEQG